MSPFKTTIRKIGTLMLVTALLMGLLASAGFLPIAAIMERAPWAIWPIGCCVLFVVALELCEGATLLFKWLSKK